MEEALKKRLIGAVTLVALAIIFVPLLLEQQRSVESAKIIPIPQMPAELPQSSEHQLPISPPIAPVIPEHILNPQSDDIQPISPVPQESSSQAAINEAESSANRLSDQTNNSIAPVAPDPDLRAWVIQAASFTQQINAQKLAQRLRAAGMQVPDPERVKIQDKFYYRVKVGPMLQKTAAESLLPQINTLSGSKGRIVLHRP